MAWTRRPLHPGFGVELGGLDLSEALSAADRAALLAEVARAGVVLIRGQAMDPERMGRFVRGFGDELLMSIPTQRAKTGDVYRVSNLSPEGEILPPDDALILQNLANELWHADMTYIRPRATVSMLYGRVIPAEGGETQFCDTRRAYERLSQADKDRLGAMTASHSVIHTRTATGYTAWTEAELKTYGVPVERPVVIPHAQSGRSALCLASYICGFSGLGEADSKALLQRLMDQATEPEEVYTHRWRVGDFVMWDNRCTMHRLRPYDYRTQARELLTTRLIDPADRAVEPA